MTFGLGLNDLERNLLNLSLASQHCPEGGSPRVVANWSGTQIHLEGVGFRGRLWSWFYWVTDHSWLPFLRMGESKEQKLCQAILHTNHLFIQFQQQVFQSHGEYLLALKKLCAGENVDSSHFYKQRRNLNAWQNTVDEWKQFLKSSSAENLKTLCDNLSNDGMSSLPLIQKNAFSAIPGYIAKMATLEGRLQSFLPLKLFYQMACSKPLEENEEKALNKFIKKITKLEDRITIGDFDQILKGLVKLFREHQTQYSDKPFAKAKLAKLELTLLGAGCQLLLKKDESYLAWRNTLKSGMTIVSKGFRFTLGDPIDPKTQFENDLNLIFALSGGRVISFPVNKALVGIKKQTSKEYAWGLKPIKHLHVDAHRRFVVKKNAYGHFCIKEIQWKSSDRLVPEDERFAMPIAKLLQWFIGQEKTPHHFSIDQLIFSNKGKLKSLKPFLEGPFDFNALVLFVKKLSKGNRIVYLFLAQTFIKHLYARFYEAIVNDASKQNPSDPKHVAAVYAITEDSIKEQGALLHQQIIDIKNGCRQEVETGIDLPPSSSVDLFKQIKSSIRLIYEKEWYAGHLPLNFNALVIEHIGSQIASQ